MAKDRDLFADTTMSFGEHLEDLRTHLWRAIVGFVVAVIVALFIGKWIVEWIMVPAKGALSGAMREYREKKLREFTKQRESQANQSQAAIAKATRLIELEAQRDGMAAKLDEDPVKLKEFQNLQEEIKQLREESQDVVTLRGVAVLKPADLAGALSPWLTQTERAKVPESAPPVSVPFTWVADKRDFGMAAFLTEDITADPTSLGAQEPFMIYLKVSMIAGFVIASPWVFWQVWSFIAVGLYPHERRIVHRFTPFSIGLFIGGVLFCFFVMLPVALRFLLSFNAWMNIRPDLRLSEWVAFATLLPLVFGLCFELPLVMMIFQRIGMFTAEDYLSKWRHAILIIAIVAMVVTPTTDPWSMMLLMGPMVALYFLGIYLARAGQKHSPFEAEVPAA